MEGSGLVLPMSRNETSVCAYRAGTDDYRSEGARINDYTSFGAFRARTDDDYRSARARTDDYRPICAEVDDYRTIFVQN